MPCRFQNRLNYDSLKVATSTGHMPASGKNSYPRHSRGLTRFNSFVVKAQITVELHHDSAIAVEIACNGYTAFLSNTLKRTARRCRVRGGNFLE